LTASRFARSSASGPQRGGVSFCQGLLPPETFAQNQFATIDAFFPTEGSSMCGIAGEIRFDGQTPDLGAIARMNQRQERRGPDNGGVYAQGSQAWGHRRLKIMDLSESAQQPMVDPELGLGIVFNGAVYNHPELRRELEGKGYRFY